MKKERAERILEAINALTEPLAEVMQEIEMIEDEETRKKLRKAVARIAADIECNLVLEISDIHPDLKALQARSKGWAR